MNEQLAKVLGIKFVKKGRCGDRQSNIDVRISKCESQYRFSFGENAAKKLGEYVK